MGSSIRVWRAIFLFAAGLILPALNLPTVAWAARPNIVLILVDDFGYECVSSNGGQSYQTPQLDRLAANGMRFEHCHVQPLCTPTRVQLMTGKYNVRNYMNFGTLMRGETTFGNLLKQAGYRTGICGKWQLGKESDSPTHFGFEESSLWQHTRRPPRYANPGLEINGKEQDYSNGEYGPQLVQDFAIDFMTRHKAEPFFLYYPMMLTHNPFQPTPDSPNWDPKAIGEKVNDAPEHFADMIAYMDKQVGEIDAKLGELGIRDNTVLLVLGDNGTNKTITSRYNGADYQGGKGTTTKHGTHVPFIASWPAAMRTARVNRDLINSTDFLPTLCELAGISTVENADGVSFVPQLKGEVGKPRDSIYAWYSPRQGNDMTVREFAFDQRFKLYRNGRLFDTLADPLETQPLETQPLETQPLETPTSTSLSQEAQESKVKLKQVLMKYANARPAELDAAFLKLQSDPTAETTKPPTTPAPKKKKKTPS